MQYTAYEDLVAAAATPPDGILSRTLHNSDTVKVVLFGFAAGQELSEHTASMPAILQIVSGEAELTLGNDHVTAAPGFWVHMDPHLKHSVQAKTATVMLLTLLKGRG